MNIYRTEHELSVNWTLLKRPYSAKKENTGNTKDETDYSREATTGTRFPSFLKINYKLHIHRSNSYAMARK